jgi:hypothetical protein
MTSRSSLLLHRRIARSLCCAFFGLCAFGTGCRSNCDLVEAELRSREDEVRVLREHLHQAECQNHALQREYHDFRRGAPPVALPEQAASFYSLKEVTLGRGTGGYDDDGCPGDEALQVVLQPYDCDGHSVKAPGALHVVALEVSAEGLKKPLSSWDVAPDQLRRTWRSGLLSTGYHVVLPWKALPTSCKLRIVAQFTLADGRAFEADKDVTIHPPAAAPGPDGPLMPPADIAPPVPVPPETPLPEPRKVEPGPVLPAKDAGDHSVVANRGRIEYRSACKPSPAPLRDAAHLLRPVPLP